MTPHDVISTDETSEQLSSVAVLARRALHFWPAVLIALGLGAIACLLFPRVRHPMFRSETVILYSESLRPDDDATRPDTARSVTVRLKEILMSRASLEEIVQKFDLYPDIRRSLGAVDAVEELRKHIEFRAPGGETVSIAFTGNSPSEARDVTAKLADVLIRQDSELRKRQAILVRDFLQTEKHTTEEQLRDAELALASFMATHPRFALDTTPLVTGAAIRASLRADATPQASSTASAWARAFARPHEPSTEAGAKGPNTTRTSSEAWQAAIAEEAQSKAALAVARGNLADLAARFTAAYPDVREAQAEVDRATSRVAASTAAATAAAAAAAAESPFFPASVGSAATVRPAPPPVAASADSHAPAKATDGAGLAASPSSAPGRSEPDVVGLETEWVRLTRATSEARQHQDQVEAALFRAESDANSEMESGRVQVTVLDPAFLPESAVPPGRLTIVTLFAAASVLLGFAAALLVALIDDRVFEEGDVRRVCPVLVQIPRRTRGSSR
jgi:capsular polysaccharide biosynthesis protein